MIALTILAILDIIADKIPVVDNIWDGIHRSRHVDGFSATINAAESGLYLYYSA